MDNTQEKYPILLRLTLEQASLLAVLLAPCVPEITKHIMTNGQEANGRNYAETDVSLVVRRNSYEVFDRLTDLWANSTGRDWSDIDKIFCNGGGRA